MLRKSRKELRNFRWKKLRALNVAQDSCYVNLARVWERYHIPGLTFNVPTFILYLITEAVLINISHE